MVSLDPDDFLADLADVPDHPSRPFPEKLAEEEELEWISNKESFPSVETCMLPEEPPVLPKAISNAEQGNGALSLPEMPSRKTKHDNAKAKSMRVCTFCGVAQTLQGALGVCNVCGFIYKSGRCCAEEESPKVQSIKSDNMKKRIKSDKVKSSKSNKVKSIESDKVNSIKRMCTHCGISQTPQWREGPLGRNTLCNACGIRYISGRLCPEYRPANSPTFSQGLHSNNHRKIMEMRNQIFGIKGTVANPVDKCTNSEATMTLEKLKNIFPSVATRNIVEQPSRSVIAEQQSPVSVLEKNTNSSTTLVSHQPPNKVLRQQHLFSNQLNNKHNQEDTAKVEVEINSTILMSSHGSVKLSYKVPSKVLEQQQLFSCQPTNKCRKKNTVELKNERINATLMSSCDNLEPPHQAPSEFLERHQLFNDQPINNCNNKYTAKVDLTMKAVDIRTPLMMSKKDSFSTVETLNILDNSRGNFIPEQQSPVWVLRNSTNSSAALMSSSESVEQQQLVYNPANNKLNKNDTSKVEIEGKNTTSMSSYGTLTLPHQVPSKFLGPQPLFFDQPNNNCNKKDTDIVGIVVKCQNCGDQLSPQQWEGALGPQTLCLSCMVAKCTPKKKRSMSLASNKKRKKEDIAKVEMAVKPGDKCTNSTVVLMNSKKDPFIDTLNISEQPDFIAKCAAQQQKSIAVEVGEMPCILPTKPSDIANAEPQNLGSGLETSKNNSIDLMSSCRIKFPHQARSKGLCRRRSTIPGQQVHIGANCMQCGKQTNRWRMGPLGPTTLCNVCGNKYQPLWGISSVIVNIAQVCQHCESEEATEWLMCPVGPKALCAACYHWIKYFCNQTNNNPDQKASTEVDNGRKCHNCWAEETPLWRSGPMGSKTLCNACGLRWYKFGDLCRQPSK